MRIIAQLKKAAKYNSNILIDGETGTGKELFDIQFTMQVIEYQNLLSLKIVQLYLKT